MAENNASASLPTWISDHIQLYLRDGEARRYRDARLDITAAPYA